MSIDLDGIDLQRYHSDAAYHQVVDGLRFADHDLTPDEVLDLAVQCLDTPTRSEQEADVRAMELRAPPVIHLDEAESVTLLRAEVARLKVECEHRRDRFVRAGRCLLLANRRLREAGLDTVPMLPPDEALRRLWAEIRRTDEEERADD